jgi:ketosteroid isomerase-like protein
VSSEENVALVKRAIAAVNARDLEGYLACCTADIELSTPLDAVAGVYERADGLARFLVDIADAGPDFRIEVQRVEAVGEDRVVAFVRTSSSGRVSGIPTAADATNVYDILDGRIRRIRIFLDRQEALRAAGHKG